MLIDLYELETTLDAGGDGGGGEPAPDPTPEPEPGPGPEPEPAAHYLTYDQAQALLASERQSWLEELAGYAQPQPEQGLPEFDPYDPDSFAAYLQAQQAQTLQQIGQMLAPVLERSQAEQADQWAEQTFERLQVPEPEHWRRGALIAASAYQTDSYGRPVQPEQAVSQGLGFLREFAAAERAAAIAEYKQQQEQQQQTLKNIAGAPGTIPGPAGVEGLYQEGDDELAVARRWRERQQAV